MCTFTLNVFNWTFPDWDGAESVQVIPSEACLNCSGGAFFQAVFDINTIFKYPQSDFAGLGGNILVNSEASHGTALVTFDGTNYVTTFFDFLPGLNEGASFVDCDVPGPRQQRHHHQQQHQHHQHQQQQHLQRHPLDAVLLLLLVISMQWWVIM